MTTTVQELNAMPEVQARPLLAECCGSNRWVTAMLALRPFESLTAVLSAADDIWRSLDSEDWLEAFSRHPRIGEQQPAARGKELAGAWASAEQSGMQQATESVRDDLTIVNREYEQRFGFIYIVCATGKTADEMLAYARKRLPNDPGTELLIAAEEQRKITRLRLHKLLESEGAQ